MDKNTRREAELMRDRLRRILSDLKLAYDNAKYLTTKCNCDCGFYYLDMCESYMNIADMYVRVTEMLEVENEGGSK